jgi:hypothetical protein
MNRTLGFMNILLLSFYLVMLFVGDGGFDQKEAIIGATLTFVPMTFTMLALEPQARFLRTAIIANILLIATYFVNSGAAPNDARNIFVLPFALNIMGLARVWFRVRAERRQSQHEPGADDRAADPQFEYVASEEQPAGNYLARHWLGELSLPVSYWVNVWGATAFCVGLIFVADKLLVDVSLRGASAASICFAILLLVVTCWSAVGAWRSAGRHVSRGGAATWAALVQMLVVFGAVATMSNFFLYVLPQTKEHWLIATGRDPVGQIEVQFTRDGLGLVLNGPFGAGSANKVEAALDSAPAIKAVVLESGGGRIGEAVRIAKLVRERKLNTYVETYCASACTFVFLAGEDRAATTHARIGFHRAFFPGMSPELDDAMTESMLEAYRATGLSDAFLARVKATKAEDIWFPTNDELVEAQVVNRVSLGGETARTRKFESKAYLAFQYAGDPIMEAINDRFPGSVDAAASAAWELHERGANDAVMWAAARKVVLRYYDKLLGTADAATLDAFLDLRFDQLKAAQGVSTQACAQLSIDSLDVSQVLPREFYLRELSWVQSAVALSNRPPAAPVNQQQFMETMQRAATRISPENLEAITNREAHAKRPEIVCAATIAFYEAVRALPRAQRSMAVRGMLQQSVERGR